MNPDTGNWIKSTFCDSNGCVEVAEDIRDGYEVINVRDTSGTIVTFTRAEWGAFLQGVKAGDFD